ncbi:MAG: DinB family protein [Flavobacteriales bacterium]|nr:DinB family protein [Flavobacteriales bacterium]
MNQAALLAELMDHTHAFTLQHMERLDGKDLHQRFSVGGTQLNSPFWILAHLAVSENWLVLRGTGGPFQKFSWAKQFTLGSTPPLPAECPSLEEVMDTYAQVHSLAIEHVRDLSDEALKSPHLALMNLDGGTDMKAVIKHHIRHESSHNGHLGWLCKLHGLPTI